MSTPPAPMSDSAIAIPHYHPRDPRPCYCAMVPVTDSYADHTSVHQQVTSDSAIHEAAMKAHQQSNISSSSASMNAAYPANSSEARVSRTPRPLPPIPTQLRGVPAPVAHPVQNSPPLPTTPSAHKRRQDRRHPSYGSDYALSQSGVSLRRRGTLFATDVPIPDDYEAPPPFHAAVSDLQHMSYPRPDHNFRTSSPPLSTHATSAGHRPPQYSQLGLLRPEPLNSGQRMPQQQHSTQASPHFASLSSTQHARAASYDAASFYSSAVSSQLASPAYQSPQRPSSHSFRPPPGTAFR